MAGWLQRVANIGARCAATVAGYRCVVVWAPCLVGVCCLTAIVGAQCEYDVETLKGPDCGLFNSIVSGQAINDVGYVTGIVGICGGLDRPIMWAPGADSYIELPMPPGITSATPTGISNIGGPNGWGTVVGTCDNGQTSGMAFMYDGKQFIQLGILPGANWSEALAVNDAGDIVGFSADTILGTVYEVVRWRAGQIEIIPLPGDPRAEAHDINEAGDIVGHSYPPGPVQRLPFLLTARNDYTELPLPIGATNGQGNAINDLHTIAGTVWGFSNDPPGRQAVVWRHGVPSIFTPLKGDDRASARGINNAGVVIGTSEAQFGGTQGCIWYHGQPHRPMDLIDPDLKLFAFTLLAINNDGVITGSVSGDGPEGVRLIPVRRTTGDTNCDKTIGIIDLLHVIGDWGVPGGPSDVNFDRTVNVHDLIDVITRWGPVPPR